MDQLVTLYFQQIQTVIWTSVKRAKIHNLGAWYRCAVALNIPGAACEREYNRLTKARATAENFMDYWRTNIVLSIQSASNFSAAFHYLTCCTRTDVNKRLNYSITRCGIREKYKLPIVRKSEVKFTSRHCTLTLNGTIPIGILAIIPAGLRSWNLTPLTWNNFKLPPVHAGKSACRQRQCKITTLRQFVYRHIIRSSFLFSSSPSRRTVAPVNLYSCLDPKGSSKVPLRTVWNRL